MLKSNLVGSPKGRLLCSIKDPAFMSFADFQFPGEGANKVHP
jgi:hypothetical protein